MKPKNKIIWIITVLVIAVISSVVIKVTREKYYSTFISCEGVVTMIEWFDDHPEKYARLNHRHGVGRSANFRTYYSFEADGKKYESSFLSYEHVSKYREGDTIEIWYNPKNPNDSSAETASVGLEVIIPYFLCAPIIVSIATFGKSKRRALYNE